MGGPVTPAHRWVRTAAWIEEAALAAVFIIMVLSVSWAVFSRYVLASPVAWADLIGRLCFTWVTFLGAAVAVKHGANIRIDFVLELLPARMRLVTEVAGRVLVLMLLFGLVLRGMSFVRATWPQKVPPLDFSYGYFALAVPVSASLMIIHMLAGMTVLTRGRAPEQVQKA